MSEEHTTPPSNPKPATQPKQTVVEELIYEGDNGSRGNGCRGCLYGIGGAAGCFVILVALIIGSIAVAGPAVQNAFDGLVHMVQGERQTRNITVPVVERIQNLQELQTTRYNFSNIIESSVEMPPLLAGLYGENIVMIAVGHIEAGIDLSQLAQDDVLVADGIMTINLPSPEILSCFLDEQQTEVVERNRGIFAPADVQLNEAARRFALAQFLDLALEDGILADAEAQGMTTITQLVGLMLEDEASLEIVIRFAEPDLEQSLPDTCPQ